MSVDLQPGARKMPSWLLIVVGAIFAVLGAIGLWGAFDVSLNGVPATGKIVEHHTASARSMTVYAQVDVALPGGRALRTEVEDTFGRASWVDGETVSLVCAKLRSGAPHCEFDSALDGSLLPLVFSVIGLGAMWWSLPGRFVTKTA